MALADLIGWTATLVGAVLGLPQLVRLTRTRDVRGLSFLAWRSTLVLNLIWLAHGLRIDQSPQVVTNVIALSITLPLVILLARSLRRSVTMALLPSIAVAGVIVAIDHTLGSLVFGAAAVLPAIFANTGQSIELVRSHTVSGVAPLFLMLACLNQSLWLTWAVLIHDPGTILAASLTLTVTSFNLGWFLLRRAGLRPLFVQPLPEPALPSPTQSSDEASRVLPARTEAAAALHELR